MTVKKLKEVLASFPDDLLVTDLGEKHADWSGRYARVSEECSDKKIPAVVIPR